MKNEEKIIRYLNDNNLELLSIENTPVYNHAGAVVVDSVLQAGLNYKTVVYPRIISILEKYASYSDINNFLRISCILGIEKITRMNNRSKNDSIMNILWLFSKEYVNSVVDIQNWLSDNQNISRLININGIGPKTIDYMKKLVGIDSFPIDRHMVNFLKLINIELNTYVDTQNLLMNVAKTIGMNFVSLDYSIWQYMSK